MLLVWGNKCMYVYSCSVNSPSNQFGKCFLLETWSSQSGRTTIFPLQRRWFTYLENYW